MTTQEILSAVKIMQILTEEPPQNQVIMLAELKQEARKKGLTREFNSMVKEVKAKLRMPTATAEVPPEIKNTAGYTISSNGIYIPLQNSDLEICPYPIFPVLRYQDIDDGTEKVKLKFFRDGEWREITQARSTIAVASKITALADNATGITSENAKAVVKYLSDIEAANRNTIPIKKSVSHLGWTDYGFIPYVDNIDFVGGENYATIYGKFHTQGDFQVWRDLSVECLKNDIPKVIVAASYASLLLKHIGVNGFCVHLWGESGRGKTVALMLGASVYGDADPKNGIIRNGKTTSSGIEPVLGFFNDCAVYFDELTTLSQEQITDMVYKFTQGQGKGRMTKNAGLQKSYTWNNVAILSAEKPLFDNATQSGAVNRVLSIYTDTSVFGDMDMVEIANTLKHNYGFGAKLFIDALKTENAEALYKIYRETISDEIEQKQANAAAVLLAAYHISCEHVYNIPMNLRTADLLKFLAGKKSVSVSMRAYESLKAWVEANYTYFDDTEILRSKWGTYSSDKTKVHIFYTRFSDWCIKNGYQERALLCEWRTRRLIKTRSKNEFKNNAKIKGQLRSDFITLNLVEDFELVTDEELIKALNQP